MLFENWDGWKGPFHDGLNCQQYFVFLKKIDNIADEFGNVANPDHRYFKTRNIDVLDENIEITIYNTINSPHVSTIEELNIQLLEVLEEWDNLKKLISNRYEIEQAEQ